MANTLANPLISCSFFIILLFSSQTEARLSKLFFPKYIHLSLNANKNHVTIPSPIPKKDLPNLSDGPPAPAPAPAPASPMSHISNAPSPLEYEFGYGPAPLGTGFIPLPLGSENPYYGLYAKDGTSNLSSNEKITNLDNTEEKEEFSNEELSSEVSDEPNYIEANAYDNAYLSNNNGFWTSTHEGYKRKNGYTNEPQGMSDTRLLDNGKYYYDVEQEDYGTSGDEFAAGKNNVGGYYYDNNSKSKNEFDSMEEYEREEGYTDVSRDDEFIP